MDQAARRSKPSKARKRDFKTKSCNIPSLTELRKSLGYGHRGKEQDIAFKKALTAQAEAFVSKDNFPGVSFTQWKTPAHQKGLRDMTKDFLVIKQKGPEFWPDDPNSSNKRPLEYTRDYDQIHRLLTKVFYRTAKEYKRKQSTTSTAKESAQKPKVASTKKPHSNKNSDAQSSRQAHQESRGQSAEDPIELDNMQSTTNASAPSVDVDPFAGKSLMFPFRRFLLPEGIPDGIPPADQPDEPTDRVWEIQDDPLDLLVPRDGNPTSSIPSHTTPKEMYQVPDSPTQETLVPRDRGKRPAQPYSIQDVRPAKAPRQEQANAEPVAGPSTSGPHSNNPSTNLSSASSSSTHAASAGNSSSSYAPTSVSSQGDPPADGLPAAAPAKRRYTHHKYQRTRFSARSPKPVQRPDFAREATMEREIPNSPPPSSSEEEDNVRGRRVQEPARPTAAASSNTSREDPSRTALGGNATADQASSLARQRVSKKQASAKKGSMAPPRAPARQPKSNARRDPVEESPAGPSTERNSAPQQANDSSTSGTGTQSSQPHMNQAQTEENQPPPNNNFPILAEESQVIDASSFLFYRHDDAGFRSWAPTANVFQMTLSELMQDLGWMGNNAQTLYMTLETPYDPWENHVEPGNNGQFNGVMRSFIKKVQRCYQRARKSNLEFELHFSQQPV
ncbi:hypothetical protein N0V84_008888 [Fusarium piperis]|uniref:Uncharacterized protein n=1 Tax=Fusarium piperis TaxID=1435070 RepID=A0A9W8W7B1_9HYPO|nr:hypothetical protein N0V84_008888 [Fusarium piperis]